MNFFDTYINTLQNHLQLTSSINSELLQICTHLNSIQVNKKKVIIIGNGGSAAIASHVATDLTKIFGRSASSAMQNTKRS